MRDGKIAAIYISCQSAAVDFVPDFVPTLCIERFGPLANAVRGFARNLLKYRYI